MNLSIRISRFFRTDGATSLKGFFNADFGYETDGSDFVPLFTVNDFSLFEKKDGSGWFVKGFARDRKRGGEVVKGPDGYPVRDPIYNRYAEQVDGAWKPTKASYKFDDFLTAKAVEAYEASAPKTPVTAGAIDEREAGSPFDNSDDDFPF